MAVQQGGRSPAAGQPGAGQGARQAVRSSHQWWWWCSAAGLVVYRSGNAPLAVILQSHELSWARWRERYNQRAAPHTVRAAAAGAKSGGPQPLNTQVGLRFHSVTAALGSERPAASCSPHSCGEAYAAGAGEGAIISGISGESMSMGGPAQAKSTAGGLQRVSQEECADVRCQRMGRPRGSSGRTRRVVRQARNAACAQCTAQQPRHMAAAGSSSRWMDAQPTPEPGRT